MENRYSNVDPSAMDAGKPNKSKPKLTPRQLIHFHINNPDIPILDEDIENLVIHTPATNSTAGTPVTAAANYTDNQTLSGK